MHATYFSQIPFKGFLGFIQLSHIPVFFSVPQGVGLDQRLLYFPDATVLT